MMIKGHGSTNQGPKFNSTHTYIHNTPTAYTYLNEFISECDLLLEQVNLVLQYLILMSQLQHLLWKKTEMDADKNELPGSMHVSVYHTPPNKVEDIYYSVSIWH